MSDHSSNGFPCLRLAIDSLAVKAEADHYAIWVIQAPLQAGLVHHVQRWGNELTQTWHAWQALFSLRVASGNAPPPDIVFSANSDPAAATSYSARLMQHLGVNLWQWVFDGPTHTSFEQSRGVSRGRSQPLRLRLEVRSPELVMLPWEIMQPQSGMPAVGVNQRVLFSRTTNEVSTLGPQKDDYALKILLVQGRETVTSDGVDASAEPQSDHSSSVLALEQEALAIAEVLRAANANQTTRFPPPVPCEVTVLVQPTPAELTAHLETRHFNVLFYSGHGMPGPGGGLLYLRPDATLSGTELAQVLTRCQVKLALFNACWGAQPDEQDGLALPRSSLAEVLIHHGVPAVLGMRDTISDPEAHAFIQQVVQALVERSPIDEAVAIARQHLLFLFKFNHVTWTLPVLYMHPEFNGELVKPLTEGITEIPNNPDSWIEPYFPPAVLHSVEPAGQSWRVYGGVMRIGSQDGNDAVLRGGSGVSRQHAEIVYRAEVQKGETAGYFLRDRSRYGTSLQGSNSQWLRVHQQEVPLGSPTRLRLGTHELEFRLEDS